VRILDLPTDLIAAARQGSEQRQHLVETLLQGFPSPYLEGGRGPLMSSFHLDDVPGAVIEADLTTETVVPRLAAAQSTVPGIARDAAAQIDVPLFLGFGATDVSPSPHNELWDRLERWATSLD
jgi:hypothetical protein